jgi:CRISPR/Cas system CMR subunit Cmr6 (Cas7 group RAMP superfamily)
MSDLPPRNWFALAVDRVQRDGFLQAHDRIFDRPGIYTGAIEIEVVVLSPVHVGSGAWSLVDGRVVKAPVERAGQPVIPGTSIKGMCRQIHEVLTQSGSPFEEQPPKPPRRGGSGRDASPPEQPSRSGALFGLLGHQGRLSFDDAVPLEPVELETVEMSVPYPPQHGQGRRFYGPMPTGADQPPRIPALALPRGTTLRTFMRLRNVLQDELGAVLIALGLSEHTPKIGGGKYDPLGWVRFRVVRFLLRSGLRFDKTPWVEDPEKVTVFCGEAIAAVRLPPAGDEALRKLRKEMQAPPSETEDRHAT